VNTLINNLKQAWVDKTARKPYYSTLRVV